MTAPQTASPRRLLWHRRAVLLGTALATIVLLSGSLLGPPRAKRDLFELPGDPTFEADRRVREFLPAEHHVVFLFVAGRDPEHRGNVLGIDLLRAVLERRDRMMADEALARFFPEEDNPLAGHPTRGPWGLAETVREVMDRQHPRVPWFGPDFASAGKEDLDRLLDMLFEFRIPLGPDRSLYPFRAQCTEDLARHKGGGWRATGLLIPAAADRARLAEAVRSGHPADFEAFEMAVDRYYAAPLPAVLGEDVRIWSYAGMQHEIDEQVQRALPLVGVAFLVMNLFVAVYFRSWRDLAVVLVSLALLVGWVKGIQAWLGYPDTQLSALLPVLILALAVDLSIHSLQRWRLLVRDHPRWEHEPKLAELVAAGRTVRSFFPALGLAIATTAIAFGTAWASPIPDLEEWGLLAVLAIFSAYWLMAVFTVYLRSALSPGTSRFHGAVGEGLHGRLAFLPRFYRRHGTAILALFAVITAAMFLVGRPDADFDARDYIDPDTRFIRGFEVEKLTFADAGEPGYLLIEGEQLATPEMIEAIRGLERSLSDLGVEASSANPEVSFVDLLELETARPGTVPTGPDGPADSPPGMGEVLQGILSEGARDGRDAPVALWAFSPAKAAELFQMEGERLTRARVWMAVPHPDDWPRMARLRAELQEAAAPLEAMPGVEVFPTGPSFVRYAYVNAITKGFVRSTWIAMGLCALLLIVALRSIRIGLITMLPVLMVAVWLQAIMVLAGISLNVVTGQVISLAIGLGIDYSIHVTRRMQEAREAQPQGDPLLWMFRTMKETGLALFASAGTTLAGFLILLLSPMPLFNMFGTIMAVMVVLSLVGGLVLLPPLLLGFGGFGGKRRGRSAADRPGGDTIAIGSRTLSNPPEKEAGQ